MRQMRRLVSIFLLTAISAPGSTQTLYMVRDVNGLLIANGRDLTTTNVNLSKPTATVDGKPATWMPDQTTDGPGAYGECQIYFDPGGSTFTLTREDGKQATATIQRTAYAAASWNCHDLKVAVSSTIVWTGGTLENCELVAAAGFDGPVLDVQQTGASPVKLKNVKIRGDDIGLKISRCYDGLFDGVTIHAEQPVYADPGWKGARNTWINCDWTAGDVQRGMLNRGILGEETILAACQWHDIDRGPLAQQAGPPMYRNLVYRCQQHRTGTTIGGSEGLLFEAPNGWPIKAKVAAKTLTYSTQATYVVPVGYFAFDVAGQKWARITSSSVSAGTFGLTYSIQLDRDLGTQATTSDWLLGNGAVENNILHFTCSSGKLGLHWFGRSAANVCRFWDCRDVHDVIVEEACTPRQDPNGSTSYGLAWGNVYDHIRCAGESRGLVRCGLYYDGAKPEEQLPWMRYAK